MKLGFPTTLTAGTIVLVLLTASPSPALGSNAAAPSGCGTNTAVTMAVPTPSEPGAYSYDSGTHDYIASADGRIVVIADQIYEVGENKFGFNKPAGAVATVSGRLVGGAAPPMGVDQFPEGSYPYNFEVMGIAFPVAGCWEMTISAGESELRFFATVTAAAEARVPSCGSFTDLVASSGAILIATVRQRQEFTGGAWATLDVDRIIGFRWGGSDAVLTVGAEGSGAGTPFTGYFLLESANTAGRLEVGSTYAVFAYGDPAQLACPQQSLAIVQADGQTLTVPAGAAPLYSARTVDELTNAVAAAA